MIDYSALIERLTLTPLKPWAEQLEQQINTGLSTKRFGDLPGWLEALAELPVLAPSDLNLSDAVDIGIADDVPTDTVEALENSLRKLSPWRKGPFKVFDIDIDTEWRSDWKWERLRRYISPLKNRLVLDVGCGNGYHCWRAFGDGAVRVIGIDPSPRFVVQFYMMKHFISRATPSLLPTSNASTEPVPVDVIPVGIEGLPDNLNSFDSVFSMGVLYHRRSPMDHLRQLRSALRPGGELVLETLIIEGENNECLVPKERYAMMNNVWFIPSAATLVNWLSKCGFTNVRCVDISKTSTEEQRATSWMQNQSLADFLDPNNPNLTVEGHPAPVRGIFIANRP